MEDLNYEDDAYIDDQALDLEWLEQAQLARKYGRNYARWEAKVRETEENIKVVRAELISKANRFPDKYLKLPDGVKPTLPIIEAYYRNNERHKEAKREWLDACEERDNAKIAYEEISKTRKAALQNMVQLHGMDYFAGPAIPHNLKDERKRRNEKVDERIAAKMTRRKK